MGDTIGELKAELVGYLAELVFDRNYPIHPGLGLSCFLDALEHAGVDHVFDVDDPSMIHFSYKRMMSGTLSMKATKRSTRSIVPQPAKNNTYLLTPWGLSSSRAEIMEDTFGIGRDGYWKMDLESQNLYAALNNRFNARFSDALKEAIMKHQENSLVDVDLGVHDLTRAPTLVDDVLSSYPVHVYERALKMDLWGSNAPCRICPDARKISRMQWEDFDDYLMPHASEMVKVLQAEIIRRLGDSQTYYYDGNPHPKIESIIDRGVEALADAENTPWGY